MILGDINQQFYIKKHDDYLRFFEVWQKNRDFIAGQHRVKSKGFEYLTMPTLKENQKIKLNGAYLYGIAQLTSCSFFGTIMRRDCTMDIQDELKYLKDSATYDKQSLNDMVKWAVQESIDVSRQGILLDYSVEAGEAFFTLYKAEDILNWNYSVINGRNQLSYIALQEKETVNDGIHTSVKTYVRIVQLSKDGICESYRIDVDSKPNKNGNFRKLGRSEYIKVNGDYMDYIPFRFVNGVSNTANVRTPIMSAIVDANCAHYQAMADLRYLDYLMSNPTLIFSTDYADDIELKAGQAYKLPAGSDAKWVVPVGIEPLENRVNKFEDYAKALGGALLSTESVANETAQSARISQSSKVNALHAIAIAVEEQVNALLGYACDLLSIDNESSIKINRDFIETVPDANTIVAVSKLLSGNQITSEDFVNFLYKAELTDNMVEALKHLKDNKDSITDPNVNVSLGGDPNA